MCKNLKLTMAIVIIVSLYGALSAFADNDYQVGTRGEGIRFAFSALADGPYGALYNPAGLSFMNGLQTQFGYHVILIEDVRDKPPPEFAEVENEIREELTEQALQGVIDDLRADSEIEVLLEDSAASEGASDN